MVSLWKRAGLVALAAGAVASAACASASGAGHPRPFPGVPTHRVIYPAPAERNPSPEVTRLIQTALAMQGRPYRLGGDDATGFDCSGFVRYVFREQAFELPRTVLEQYGRGTAVDDRDIQPGDLLFFSTATPGPTHVGIALNPAEAPGAQQGRAFIHAPGENGAVRIDFLENGYWKARFLGARRLF